MRVEVGTRVGERPDVAASVTMPRSGGTALAAARQHWPEYMMEAIGLALFMLSACVFVTLLEHPNSPVRQTVTNPFLRRIPVGLAMGLTAVGLIYSPWGPRSGAHLNPSVTLTFWRLGKVTPWDAFFYVTAQFVGAIVGSASPQLSSTRGSRIPP
jgi:aquaporin Z